VIGQVDVVSRVGNEDPMTFNISAMTFSPVVTRAFQSAPVSRGVLVIGPDVPHERMGDCDNGVPIRNRTIDGEIEVGAYVLEGPTVVCSVELPLHRELESAESNKIDKNDILAGLLRHGTRIR
jgi:hypothetical protein